MLERTTTDWEALLSTQLELPVEVLYGRSRSAPVQVRWKSNVPNVRLHRMFEEAPEEIALALGAWIKNGKRARRACRELDEWIQRSLAELPPAKPRKARRELAGKVHDLGLLAAQLRSESLAGAFGPEREFPELTWGRRARSRSRHTLQLGSYSPEQHLVRIHPVLDQDGVPDWFVRYVLFHELLHALIPAEREGEGRWRHHGPEFRRRERAYIDYRRALDWERNHLPDLIRSARTGKPLAKRRAPKLEDLVDALQGLLFP